MTNSRKIIYVLLLLSVLPVSYARAASGELQGRWRLKEFKVGEVSHDGVTLCMGDRTSRSPHYDFRPYIEFRPGGSFSAHLCCGSIDGVYSTGGRGSISLESSSSYGSACLDLQFEDEDFLSTLRAVDSVETGSDEFTLTASKTGAMLVYVRELPPATPKAVSTLVLSCTFAIPKASVAYGKNSVEMTENNFHIQGGFTADRREGNREKNPSSISITLSAETSGEEMSGDVAAGTEAEMQMRGRLKRGVDGAIIDFFISTADQKYILNCSAAD